MNGGYSSDDLFVGIPWKSHGNCCTERDETANVVFSIRFPWDSRHVIAHVFLIFMNRLSC